MTTVRGSREAQRIAAHRVRNTGLAGWERRGEHQRLQNGRAATEHPIRIEELQENTEPKTSEVQPFALRGSGDLGPKVTQFIASWKIK